MIKKRCLLVAMSVLLLVGLSLPLACKPAPTLEKPVKVGVICGETSFLAFHGKWAKYGVMMAEEEINEKGGVLGQPIEVVWRPSHCKADAALREARSLVFEEKVDFLMGCIITSTATVVHEFAEENKILFLNAAASQFFRTTAFHPYYFTTSQGSTIHARGLVHYIKGKGFQTLWFVAPDYAYGHDAVASSKTILAEIAPEIEVIGESWPPLGEKDFGPYISEISRAEPDIIFSWIFGGDQGAFLKQAGDFGLFEKMQYLADLAPESLRPYGLEAPEGLLGSSFYEFLLPDTPENKAYAEKFNTKYGDYPTAYATQFYDGLHMLALAIEEAGTIETEAVIDALEKVHYKSPMGELYYREIDHQLSRPIIVGETVKIPELGYCVIGGPRAEVIPAEKVWLSEDEVRAIREAAKK